MKTINKLDPDIALNRILKLQNFRLQSNYELRDLLNIFVLSWRCGDTHKYISLGISDSDAIKENAGDNIIQMLGEDLGSNYLPQQQTLGLVNG